LPYGGAKTMKKYALLITTDQPFNHETHPRFFAFLLSKTRSVRISDDVFCFEQEEGITAAYAELEQLLKENDEVVLFDVHGARWGTGRPELDERLKEVFS
jgi:hypothetical protein